MKRKESRLCDIIALKAGANITRMAPGIPRSMIYTSQDIEDDLDQAGCGCAAQASASGMEPGSLRAGDVVVSLATGRAAVVTESNAGKVLRNTEAICRILGGAADPWYLCYFFNESRHLKEAMVRGLVGSQRFLTISELLKLDVQLPPLGRQKAIGRIYRDLCRLDHLQERRRFLVRRLVLGAMAEGNGGN